jgi:hypothetical protein
MTVTQSRDLIASDTFLTRALADLVARGMDEDRAITVVLNTYND